MFQIKTLTQELSNLVGFSDTYGQGKIDADLKTSLSGYVIGEGVHPLLTQENILSLSEQFLNVETALHDPLHTYSKGDIARDGEGGIFQSLQDENTSALNIGAAWKKTNLYSAYLRRLRSASIANLFGKVFLNKKIQEVSKTLQGSVYLYDGVGNLSDRVPDVGRMMGFKVKLRSKDISVIVRQIGLQLDKAAQAKVYLFHSSNPMPLQTIEINHTSSARPQWHQQEGEGLVLGDIGPDIFPGGTYYICFRQDELQGALAVRKQINLVNQEGCTTCGGTNRALFNSWNKFFSVQPFFVNAEDLPEDGSLWEESKEFEVNDNTFGLNLQLSVVCDVTRVILENKSVVAEALVQQIKHDLLSAMAFSARNNVLRDKVGAMAAVALDNKENGEYGEAKKLNEAVKALSFDFSGLSAVCLPCNDTNTQVRVRSVWG